MADIEIERCGDTEFRVTVSEGRSRTTHRVTLSDDERERLAPTASPEDLLRESFRFLLEREPKESILQRFPLSTIERYFPEYPAQIATRLRSS